MNKKLNASFQKDLQNVRQRLHTFDPSGFTDAEAPDDEYDALATQILRHVYSQAPHDKMKELILANIEHYYGTPNISNLQEPFKTEFYQDLDVLCAQLKDGFKSNFM